MKALRDMDSAIEECAIVVEEYYKVPRAAADHLEKVEAQLRVARKALAEIALGRGGIGLLEIEKFAQQARGRVSAAGKKKAARNG